MPLDLKHSKMRVQLIVNGWASNLRLFWYKVVSSPLTVLGAHKCKIKSEAGNV
jgi:hypothetical protein